MAARQRRRPCRPPLDSPRCPLHKQAGGAWRPKSAIFSRAKPVQDQRGDHLRKEAQQAAWTLREDDPACLPRDAPRLLVRDAAASPGEAKAPPSAPRGSGAELLRLATAEAVNTKHNVAHSRRFGSFMARSRNHLSASPTVSLPLHVRREQWGLHEDRSPGAGYDPPRACTPTSGALALRDR